MPFDLNQFTNPIGTWQDAAGAIAKAGLEKTQEAVREINLLLKLLQSAGYAVDSLEIELSLPPRVTMDLKTGPLLKEEKLDEILRQHSAEKLIVGVVASLIQANKLRGSVTVETLEMESVGIVLTTTPNITLQWKDKEKKASAAA
jgi:hypothetical protein